jgi:hypothetical protein
MELLRVLHVLRGEIIFGSVMRNYSGQGRFYPELFASALFWKDIRLPLAEISSDTV